MTMRRGLPAKLAATDADDTRYDFKNLVTCNADGSPRGGVTSPIGSNIVSATATMNVSVSAFAAVAVRDGGAILLSCDGPTNVLLANAPVANSRIDVVYAKQNDASSTVTAPDANNSPILGVAQGTASATPTKPAIPTGAVELASVLIPSGATATNSVGVVISQTGVFTSAGGIVPFRLKSDLDLWTTAAVNQRAVVLADMTEYAYAGPTLKWVPVGLTANVQLETTNSIQRQIVQRGIGRITGNNTNVISKAVTFPQAFSDIPHVSVSYIGFRGLGSFNPVGLTAGSAKESQPQAISLTGFTASLALPPNDGTWPNVSDFYFSWLAIGPM